MNNDRKEQKEKNEPAAEFPQVIPKISKIVFDEATGTVTLKIASEEEIAEAEKLKEKKG